MLTEPIVYVCHWDQLRPHPGGTHVYHVCPPGRTDSYGEPRYLRALCGRSLDGFDVIREQPPAMHRLCKICRAASGRGGKEE